MGKTALNRSGVILLTNKSGGSVAKGDVVVIDATTAASFTTTATEGYSAGAVGVVLEPNGIASNATGTVAFYGYVSKVNLDASATLGYFIKTDNVAKQGTPVSARTVGVFGVVLGTGTTPAAHIWCTPDRNVDSLTLVAARYKTAAAQSIDNATFEIVDFGTSDFDTHSAVTTGASWKFTVPTAEGGKYNISARIMYTTTTTWATNESTTMALYKNGTVATYLARYQTVTSGVDHNVMLGGSTVLDLSAADYIDVRLHQSSGAGLALHNDALYNHVSIFKVH